mgnify:CR=1 FL=1
MFADAATLAPTPATLAGLRRGELQADLVFEALRPPHSHPTGVPPFWRGRHFDQCMHVTGQIELHGETIDIDSYSVRDRSWGPRPAPRAPGVPKGASRPRKGFIPPVPRFDQKATNLQP